MKWIQFLRWHFSKSYAEFRRQWRSSECKRSSIPEGVGVAANVRIMSPEFFHALGAVYLDYGVYAHCGHVDWCPHIGSIQAGNNTYIGPYSVLFGMGEIELGRDVMVSPHVVITSVEHPITDISSPMYSQPRLYGKVTVGDDVYIGSGAVITPGVTIGRGAVVGAGAVVTKDIPEYSIAVGVPARVKGIRSKAQATLKVAPAEA